MKRCLATTIAMVLLFLSLSTLVASADPLNSNELRSLRNNYNKGVSFELGEGTSPLSEVYYRGISSLTILLYTDLLPNLTLKNGYSTPESAQGLAYSPVLADKVPSNEDESFEWLYCAEFEAVLSSRYEELFGEDRVSAMISSAVPALWYCVKEFDISKEELYAAREKMYKSPDSIREKLPITDQQAERWLVSELDEERWALQDFMIEALYLEDHTLAQQLLLCPWYQWSSIGAISIYNVYYGCNLKGEKIADFKAVQPYTTSEEYRVFCEYSKLYGQRFYPQGERWDWCLDVLGEWSKNAEAPPQTGDGTAAYALIFTLAALPLAGLGVAEWKRRRRAV